MVLLKKLLKPLRPLILHRRFHAYCVGTPKAEKRLNILSQIPEKYLQEKIKVLRSTLANLLP